jgi:hypothetical protein
LLFRSGDEAQRGVGRATREPSGGRTQRRSYSIIQLSVFVRLSLCVRVFFVALRQKLAVENFQMLERLKRASSKPTFDTWSQQDPLKQHLRHNMDKVRQLRLEAMVADNFKLVSRLANTAVRRTAAVTARAPLSVCLAAWGQTCILIDDGWVGGCPPGWLLPVSPRHTLTRHFTHPPIRPSTNPPTHPPTQWPTMQPTVSEAELDREYYDHVHRVSRIRSFKNTEARGRDCCCGRCCSVFVFSLSLLLTAHCKGVRRRCCF